MSTKSLINSSKLNLFATILNSVVALILPYYFGFSGELDKYFLLLAYTQAASSIFLIKYLPERDLANVGGQQNSRLYAETVTIYCFVVGGFLCLIFYFIGSPFYVTLSLAVPFFVFRLSVEYLLFSDDRVQEIFLVAVFDSIFNISSILIVALLSLELYVAVLLRACCYSIFFLVFSIQFFRSGTLLNFTKMYGALAAQCMFVYPSILFGFLSSFLMSGSGEGNLAAFKTIQSMFARAAGVVQKPLSFIDSKSVISSGQIVSYPKIYFYNYLLLIVAGLGVAAVCFVLFDFDSNIFYNMLFVVFFVNAFAFKVLRSRKVLIHKMGVQALFFVYSISLCLTFIFYYSFSFGEYFLPLFYSAVVLAGFVFLSLRVNGFSALGGGWDLLGSLVVYFALFYY